MNHTELGMMTGLPHLPGMEKVKQASHRKANLTVTKTKGVSQQTSTNIFGGFLSHEGSPAVTIGCYTKPCLVIHDLDD